MKLQWGKEHYDVVYVCVLMIINFSLHAGEGNMKLHCCVAAYVSDYAFLGTALLPYPNYRAKFSASLDHAMWFHSTFRTDEWMLYECESPWAGEWEYGERAALQDQVTGR